MNIYEAQQLKQLERDYDAPAPAPKQEATWATGTSRRPDQTMRHPRTGEPLTPKEAEALARALRLRRPTQNSQ